MKWRLIIDEADVYTAMALDEALLISREENTAPNTLRLYRILPHGVTIGYFQRVNHVLNLEYLRQNKIPYTRRITGGGAVYHDGNGEITYSVTADIKDIAEDVMESYKKICRGIVNALRILGIKAEYKPINDIIVNNKKISGSAQTRRKHALLQHGTLMYATNLDILEKTLKPPREKLESHKAKTIKDRLTTIEKELGYKPKPHEIMKALIQGFMEALDIEEVQKTKYTTKEQQLAKQLTQKYKDQKWVHKR